MKLFSTAKSKNNFINMIRVMYCEEDEELLEMYYSEIKFQIASEDDLRKYLNCS